MHGIIGPLGASWIVPEFIIEPKGLMLGMVVFALARPILAPCIFRISKRYAPAALIRIGLLSTLSALIITSVVIVGLVITGFATWVLASLVVWMTTAPGPCRGR